MQTYRDQSTLNSNPQSNTSFQDDKAAKDTFTEKVAKAGNDAVKIAKEMTADVADQVGTAASDLASAASEHTKTFASEVERLGRANPLGALAGALLVGVVIGLIGRRR